MQLIKMPLFPLNTVLFPGGVLTLRLFEPRYLTMIGQRMREDKGFAVMLLRDGAEAGGEAAKTQFYAVGTEAKVIDFDQLDDGMLSISCRGGRLMRAQSHWVQPDQLIVAELEPLTAEPSLPVPLEYQELSAFLRKVLAQDEAASYRQGLEEDWSSADWVSCRLAELLPLTLASKQTLLETDTLERLDILYAIMQEHSMFKNR